MSNVLTDFISRISIEIKDGKLKQFSDKMDTVASRMKDAEIKAWNTRKSFNKLSGGLTSAAKGQNKLNAAIKEGNKQMTKQFSQARYALRNQRQVLRARGEEYERLFGGKGNILKDQIRQRLANSKYRSQKFGNLVVAEKNIQARLESAKQAAHNAEVNRQKVLAQMQKEYLRNMEKLERAKQRAARQSEIAARREAAAAERRMNAERRLQAYQERSRMMANRVSGGAGGAASGGGFARHAALGGAFGATMSNLSGFLPGIGIGWGLTRANQINQELISNRLALTAITGSEESARDTEMRFRQRAETLGIDWRATQPSFRKMLASGMGAGMTQDQVEKIFQGTAEYGRVMGLGTEDMKGSFRALEQIMN